MSATVQLSSTPPPPAAIEPALDSPRALFFRRFLRHRLAVASIFVLGVLYFAALFAEFVAPYSQESAGSA